MADCSIHKTRARRQIPADYVRSRLSYDPDTGIFTWNPKPPSKWSVRWNNRYAGKEAGTVRAADGYRVIGINNTPYLAHILAWLIVNGEYPEHEIDHINRCRSDNRLANLRGATHAENTRNTPIQSHNTSGHKGVSLRKGFARPIWRAHINVNRKQICLGSHRSFEEAIEAYRAASVRYHGEFGNLE